VKKAIDQIEAEVIVVDNNSNDGSMDYIQPIFPWVKFIQNRKNEGFSKANNLALSKAKAKFILFLNPDTIVAEDSFEKCISFLETNPEAGSVGVKMIDGQGNYLKESKRGFPTPWASFCKLSGLTALFPRTKLFAGYYLGYLNEKENQEIDVISGAFMFVRKDSLDRTGDFDEQFFMYGEDIDLSYRIQLAGYKNFYLAETTIIHFKGESTKKDYKNVKLFYTAMIMFARKHFSSRSTFLSVIQAGIWLRGMLSAIKNLLPKKTAEMKMETLKIYLTGDKESKNGLEKILSTRDLIIVKNEAHANITIFCEGATFSFKNIIVTCWKKSKNLNFGFHGSNSGYFVKAMKKSVKHYS
jgi:GT2 family glycosyltransferase